MGDHPFDMSFTSIPVGTRRSFLRGAGALAVILASGQAPVLRAGGPASGRVRVAVVGLGRGMDHVSAYLQVPNVEVVALCDVDERRLGPAVQVVAGKQGIAPRSFRDFRRVLEDRGVDAVSIAMPNFWHAPATILACQAGKHVYVEKPGSHNVREGRLMVAAARANDRRVQMGTQRRSCPEIVEAMAQLRAGVIGRVRFARCWYDNARRGIGRGRPVPVPAELDYSLWQGPVPERPYVDNLVHYNWHWRWHWGGGELANNGIHALDLARWGLEVEAPGRVTCNGGRYHGEDDQETPDTTLAAFDFGGCGASWDGSSCLARKQESNAFVSFYGDGGVLSLDSGAGWKVFDPGGREIKAVKGRFSDVPHFRNFVDSIRDGARLNAEIVEGQKSTLLCHLGNIAYRTRRALDWDAVAGRIRDGAREQVRLLGREYRKGWEPRV